MKSHVYQERKRNRAILIIVSATLMGFVYIVFDRKLHDIYAVANGLLIGFIGGAFIASFELYLSNPLNKKVGFINKLVFKSLTYMLFFMFLVPAVYAFTRSIQHDMGYFEYLGSEKMLMFFLEQYYLIVPYTLICSSVIIFILQLSRKLGQHVLWNFITGKYWVPKEEERIFMFLDLNNSTKIAEKLGEIEFNNFLNEVFLDLANPILSTYGEIYRYVGDEVVVTWKMKNGLKHANCLRTFFQSKYTMHILREKYLSKYGLIPTFTASFHCGKVIAGEIGDIKSQITYSGDVLYATASIEKLCSQLKKENLVSETLIKRISLPDIYEMKLAGTLDQKNKHQIDLYTISEIEMASA